MTTQWCKSNPTTAYHTCVTKLLKLIFKFAATLIKFVLTISFVCSFSYSLVWTSLHMVWPFSHSSNVIFTSNESEYCYFLCEPVFSYCWQMVNFFSFIITVGIYYMPMIISCCHFLTACEQEMYAITAKRPRQDSSCETFSLTVRGRRNYELLSRIRDSLEMTEQLVPHGERDRYVQQRRQSEYV